MRPARFRRWDVVVLLSVAVLAVAGRETGEPSDFPVAEPSSAARISSETAGFMETLLPSRAYARTGSWVDRDRGTDRHTADMAVLLAGPTMLVLSWATVRARAGGRPSGRHRGRSALVRGPPLLLTA